MPTRSRSKYFAVVLDFSAPFTTVSAKSKHSHVKLGTETAVIFVTVSTLSLYKLNPRLVKPEVLLSVVSCGYCGLLFINTVPSYRLTVGSTAFAIAGRPHLEQSADRCNFSVLAGGF